MSSNRHMTPYQWPIRFFRWFCRADVVEDIEGDLLERFEVRSERQGHKKAQRLLIKDVLQLFRPGMIKFFNNKQKLNYYDMFKHNITLSFRNFRRHPGNFAINMVGLTAGLICTLLIYLWVSDELSVDKYHENKDNLFQIMSNMENGDEIYTWRGVPGVLLEEIQATVPEAKMTVATTDPHEYALKYEETSFKALGRFASPDYFKMFSFPLVAGNPETALSDKANVVISESMAEKLFGSENPIGKTLDWFFWDFHEQFVVSAVMEDIPNNSSEHFEFVLSWDYYHNDLITYKVWGNFYGRLMVILNDPDQQYAAGEKIDAIFEQNNENDKDRINLFLTN